LAAKHNENGAEEIETRWARAPEQKMDCGQQKQNPSRERTKSNEEKVSAELRTEGNWESNKKSALTH
jgi:hypothetical protein